MPAYTSPDNIQYPVSGDQVAPLETVFANVAQSTQNALTNLRTDFDTTRALHTYRWANAAARTAQTGMQAGDAGYQEDTLAFYVYLSGAWRPQYSPSAYIDMSTSQSTTTGVVTTVSAWTENSDGWNWHSAVTNTSRVTPNVAGRYQYTIQGAFASNSTGLRYYAARFNGAAFNGADRIVSSAASDGFGAGIVIGERSFNGSTDYMEVDIFQTSGGALVTNTRLVLRYLGPA